MVTIAGQLQQQTLIKIHKEHLKETKREGISHKPLHREFIPWFKKLKLLLLPVKQVQICRTWILKVSLRPISTSTWKMTQMNVLTAKTAWKLRINLCITSIQSRSSPAMQLSFIWKVPYQPSKNNSILIRKEELWRETIGHLKTLQQWTRCNIPHTI